VEAADDLLVVPQLAQLVREVLGSIDRLDHRRPPSVPADARS
jgi:hypothetical protein